jgi:hypothetical protein
MTNIRLLKNARSENSKVSKNELYNFSINHTLSIYPLDAICTFVPKNACSSLRFSIGIANGFIKDIDDINWIHQNPQTFVATQKEVVTAKYTFIVLRCPYTRIASCFLDKIVDGKFDFKDSNGEPVSINFHEFLLYVKSQIRSRRDQHWRNQSDFLHYEKYDDYFSLESFPKALVKLESNGFTVHDTREALQHNLSAINSVEGLDGSFSKMKELDLKKMKSEGHIPNYRSMFGNQEIDLVKEIYNDDIELYKEHFGGNNLLFS